MNECPRHNFVFNTPVIMKSGTGVESDVFYTMVVTKNVVMPMPLILPDYDFIIRIYET